MVHDSMIHFLTNRCQFLQTMLLEMHHIIPCMQFLILMTMSQHIIKFIFSELNLATKRMSKND